MIYLIFLRKHNSDGGLWIVDVERTTRRDDLHQPGGVIVVADVQSDRDSGAGYTC